MGWSLAVIIDSSGSYALLGTPIGEMAAIHSELRPTQLTLLHVDTEVHHVDEVDPDDVFPKTEVREVAVQHSHQLLTNVSIIQM